MKNSILLSAALVIFGGFGLYYWFIMPGNPATMEGFGHGLFPRECELQSSDFNTTLNSKMYGMDGKIRADYTYQAQGRIVHTHSIFEDGMQYSWFDEFPDRTKEKIHPGGTGWFEPLTTRGKCRWRWSLDPQLFELPAGAPFIDVSR